MSKGTHRKSSSSVTGSVAGAMWAVAGLAVLVVGTPIAVIVLRIVT